VGGVGVAEGGCFAPAGGVGEGVGGVCGAAAGGVGAAEGGCFAPAGGVAEGAGCV
jgi:hypothetical protein